MSRTNKISALQEIRAWSSVDVQRALHQHGMSDVEDAFTRRSIDGDGLLDLTEGRLALWKKDLSLASIRRVVKFVTDINNEPHKYLLQAEDDVEYGNVDSAGATASWLHSQPPPPLPNRGAFIPSPRHSSPSGSDHSWGTDFDDNDVETPPSPPAPKPVASSLHRPPLMSKPSLPSAAAKPRTFPNGAVNVISVPAKLTSLPKPPVLGLENFLAGQNFRASTVPAEDDAEYFEIDDDFQSMKVAPPNQDYLEMNAGRLSNTRRAPSLPSREPKMNQPVLKPHIPTLPSRDRPQHNIPKLVVPPPGHPPALPNRGYLLKKPAESGAYKKSPEPPKKFSNYPNYKPPAEPDDEYEEINDPGGTRFASQASVEEDYLQPIVRQKIGDVSPASSRRESDSSTSSLSSGGMALALRQALRDRSTSDLSRESEVHKLPSYPPPKTPAVDRPSQFSGTNQRPLPPTPDPKRTSERPPLTRLVSQAYYFAIDRKRAEDMLRNREDSQFLVRPSTRSSNPYTLTLWYNQRMYNIGIRLRSDQRYALGTEKAKEQTFESVEELIAYYRKEELVLYSNGKRTGTTALISSPPQELYTPSPF